MAWHPALVRRVVLAVVVVAALTALAASVGRSALTVRTELTATRAALQDGVDAAVTGDLQAAAAAFDRAVTRADEAVAATRTLGVRLVGSLPVVGQAVRSATSVAEAARLVAVAGDGLVTAAAAAPAGLDGLTFGSGADGRWLESLQAVQAPVRYAAVQLRLAADLLAAAPADTGVRQVDAARAALLDELAAVLPTIERGEALAQALPPFLGAEGTRRYFVGAQNPAELRGTGGLIGAYATLTVTDGRFTLSPFQSVGSLANDLLDESTAPSPEFLERYGSFLQGNGTWSNINATPDFPSAATAIENFFQEATGGRVDGVIVMDPFALEAMIERTGPVDTDEVGRLEPGTLVRYLTEDAPTQFETGGERKEVLGEAAEAVLDVFLSERVEGRERVAALAEAAAGGHLLVHSVHPEVQAGLVEVGVAGELPAPEPGVLAVAGYNLVETKGDLFVHRAVDYDLQLNPDGSAVAAITITLRNEAPTSGRLPYFIGPNLENDPRIGPGDNATMLSVYCGPCEHVSSEIADDWSFDVWEDTELGHRVLTTIEQVDSAEVQTTRHYIELPSAWRRAGSAATASLTLWDQPTINPTSWSITVRPPAGWSLQAAAQGGLSVQDGRAVWQGVPDRVTHFNVDLRRDGTVG